MIYSCTMYLDEDRLLKLKLEEERSIVDKTIIVVGEKSFSKKEKPQMPDVQSDKVEVYTARFRSKNARKNAKTQRDWPLKVIDLKPDDVLIVSDVDEIHRREELPYIISMAREYGYAHIRQWMHLYKLNMTCLTPGAWWYNWISGYVVTGKYLMENNVGLDELRTQWRLIVNRQKKVPVIYTNGHHFSWMGGVSVISHKLRSFTVTSVNNPKINNKKHIQMCIDKGKHLFLGGKGRFVREGIGPHYPAGIRDSIELWRDWLI